MTTEPGPVNYYFTSNSVINSPVSIFEKRAAIVPPPSPTPNFSYKQNHYFAKHVFLCSNSNKNYFIIRSETDPTEGLAKNFYVALELDPTGKQNPSANLEGLITTAVANKPQATIGLNKVFSDLINTPEGSSGKLVNENCFVAKNPLGVKLPSDKKIQDLPKSISLSGGVDTTIRESYIGWDLSCVLLDDNGKPFPNPTTNTPAIGSDNANTLILLTLVILITCGAYISSSIVYPFIYDGVQKISDHITDKSINSYFALFLFFGSIPSFILSPNQPTNLLLGLVFILCYFAGTASVKRSLQTGADGARVDNNNKFLTDDDWTKHMGLMMADSESKFSSAMGILFGVIGFCLAIAGASIAVSKADPLLGQNLFISGTVIYVCAPIARLGYFIFLNKKD